MGENVKRGFVDTFSLRFSVRSGSQNKGCFTLLSKIYRLACLLGFYQWENVKNKLVLFSSHQCVTVSQDKAHLLERRSLLKVCLPTCGSVCLFSCVCLCVCWTTQCCCWAQTVRPFVKFLFVFQWTRLCLLVRRRAPQSYFNETLLRFSEGAEREYKKEKKKLEFILFKGLN